MVKDRGMTIAELLTIIAIIGIIAALAYPSFRRTILRINLKKDLTIIYGDFATARASAMEKGCDWDIMFLPDQNAYVIFSDNGIVSPGPDGEIFTEDDVINTDYRNNGVLDNIYGEKATSKKVNLKFSRFGIPSDFNVTKLACMNQPGNPPSNGVDFVNNIVRFSYLGVARSGGAVYITNGKDLYAISVTGSTGKITLCKWYGSIWK